MSARDLLIEIGTEELPPKALRSLSLAFESGIKSGLDKSSLSYTAIRRFATPRRLAVIVDGLIEQQADKVIQRLGPATKAAFDANGEPTKAATGFAKSCGVEVGDLGTATKDGVEKLSFSATEPGKSSTDIIPAIVTESLNKLPIPKRMRWGSSRIEFVRPVHWVVLLFGEEAISASILGLEAGTTTRGHRFHHDQEIAIPHPDTYESLLENTGYVLPDFEKRKEIIRQMVIAEGKKVNASAVIEEALLDEVAGLVEYPVALTGKFEEEFLEVPAEALVLAMKSHQKCFNLVDDEDNLVPYFITISNINSKDPIQVVQGNERVIRPRLADARFFYETDQKVTLESRLPQLDKIVFQAKLGTVLEKSQRVSILAGQIAVQLGFNANNCERAALLSKCDLLSNMVGEFADLQGLMGCYYARNDGEPEDVALAINEQYMPRFAGDSLPTTDTGAVLAIAEKLDTMVGMFAIGQPPTGSKDPFALRRSAIGLLRILVEKQLDLDLLELISTASAGFPDLSISEEIRENVFEFLLERFRSWYSDTGVSADVFQSVFTLKPSSALDFHKRVLATHEFNKLPEAEALAAANKRVSNLLSKIDDAATSTSVDESIFEEDAEKFLYIALSQKELDVAPLFESGNYQDGLLLLADLRSVIDSYFENVLVMCDDPKVKDNRIALLRQLRNLFLRVADISYLHSS